MKNGVVPGHVQKLQDLLEPEARLQHQLLVVDGQAGGRAQLLALRVHRLHRRVPLLHALPEVFKVEPRNRYLK